MATLVLTNLAPGRTAVLQLYTRGTNVSVGSLITGTSSGSTYSFAGVPDTGDYDALLSGFSTPNAARFPIRNAVAYVEDSWDLIDATVFVPAVTAPTPANTCSVVIRAHQAGSGKQVRVLIVSLGSSGRFDDKAFVNRTIDETTDVTGLLVAQLPWSSIPGIGKYRVRLIDIETGEVLHDRVCTVPDEEELDYEDLPSTSNPTTPDTPGSFLIREVDGSPSSVISTLVVSNGSLTVEGGTGTLQVGGSLTVREADGTPSDVVTTLVFPNGTITIAAGVATITGLEGPTGPQGPAGATGATGPAGAAGPNTVTTSTATNITGVLYGNGTVVSAATAAQRLGTFTKAELDTAVSDGNVLYVGDVTSNATHTGDVTGATALTIADAAVTLAKMANLTQDQFIGRTTASTGVPQTATITAAARTVLDDSTVAAMVDTLGGASSTGTGGLVRATSPTLVTPNIGAATGTTLVLTAATSNNGAILRLNTTSGTSSVQIGQLDASFHGIFFGNATPSFGQAAIFGSTTQTIVNASSEVLLQTSNVTRASVTGSGLAVTGNLTASGTISTTANGAASTPASTLVGTWFTGGTATTTKPQLLVEPTGTTSTGWSTSGTGIGVNAASGFTGNLIDVQLAGVNRFRVTSAGDIYSGNGNFSVVSGFVTCGRVVGVNNTLVLYDGGGFPAVALGSNTNIYWESGSTVVGSRNVGLVRSGSGQIGVNDGTNGSTNWRDVILRNLTASGTITLGSYTIGTLPSAAANTRAQAFATDSSLAFNSTNLGSTVTAGGANLVPVWSNGTNWVIG